MYKKKETLREAMYSRSLQVDKKMDLNWLTKEYKLTELDFKGTFFKNWPIKLAGNTDVLSLGRPDIIEEVHRKSLESGADIVTTNTVMSQSLCQKKYGLGEERYVEFLNRASVRIAQFEANKMSAKTPDKPRYVIGSVGPTSKMLSKYGVGDSDTIDATFDTLEEAYMQQMKIMILEGVDAVMVEGVTDTLNASSFVPVGAGAIPTGEILPVKGTEFDFTKSKKISKDIGNKNNEQIKQVGGFDHNWIIDGWKNNGKLILAAVAEDDKSGRKLECYTDLPGVQFYAGNFIGSNIGKQGYKNCKRKGFCLETQYYPNSANVKSFPQPIFDSKTPYDSTTVYKFTW